MKTVIVIWLAVLVTVVGGVAFVNAEINKRVELPTSYNGKVLQASDESTQILQPTGNVKPNFTTTRHPQPTASASVLETNAQIKVN